MVDPSLNQLFSYIGEENLLQAHASIDSRTIKKGDIFFALQGKKVDAHNFLSDVFDQGAALAVVKKGKGSFRNCIEVDDPLYTLQALAQWKFNRLRPKTTIAVTGSVGKTTTKEFIATLLEEEFSLFKSPGNSNSQVGLPLAILNEFHGEEVAVVEMGMTEKGQIRRLVEIMPPDMALITSVAYVHAGNFASLREIGEAKGEIFSHPKTKLGFYLKGIQSIVDLEKIGTCKKVAVEGVFEEFHLETSFGKHNQDNLKLALAIARSLNISSDKIQGRIKKLKLPDGRQQRMMISGILFIDDAYNASCPSMLAAFQNLPKSGRKIAVLGEMLDLGSFSEQEHKKVGEEAKEVFDELIALGDGCQPVVEAFLRKGKPASLHCTHLEIAKKLKRILKEGDVVLVKGSNSKRMWEVIDNFKSMTSGD